MRAPRTAPPATSLPRLSRLDTAEAPRPIWLWRGAGPALTPHGLVPLDIEGAAPAVMTPSGPGIRIERGTTNFVTNPSFEMDLAGWAAVAGASISRETAVGGAFGDAYARVAVSASGDGIRFAANGNATQGQPYAASMYLRAATPSDAGKTVQVYLDAPGGGYEIFATDHVLTETWTRVVIPATWAQAGHTGWGVIARSAIAQGPFTFLLDAVQYEAGVASTYVDGSLGQGFIWTGSVHGSTSVRSGSSVRSRLTQRMSGMSASLVPSWPVVDGATHTLIDARGTAGQFARLTAEPTGVWRATLGAPSKSDSVELAQEHDPSELITLTARWTRGFVEIGLGATPARAPLTIRPDVVDLSLGCQEDASDDYLSGVLTNVTILGV